LGRPEHWQEWVGWLKTMRADVYKVVALGDSGLDATRFLIDNGIMPIVRFYRGTPNPGSMVDEDPRACEALPRFIALGVRYFEVNNEPNLFVEWKGQPNAEGVPAAWQAANPDQPKVVAASWVKDARFVLAHGGLPGIPAMSPGGNYNDMDFLRLFFQAIIDTGNADLMGEGVWLSVHPAGFNHPLDYPFDSVNQKGTPLADCEFGAHRWRFGTEAEVNAERVKGKNAGQTLLSVNAAGRDTGASNGWLKWWAVGELFKQYFGFYAPVFGTEGGFWRDQGDDPRYHILNEWDVSDRTRKVAEALVRGDYPDWFFGFAQWLIAEKGMEGSGQFEHDAWFSLLAGSSGHWPVVANLMEMPDADRMPYNGWTPWASDIPPEPEPPLPAVLTDQQIANVLSEAGFSGEGWTIGVAVVLAESGGDTRAVGDIDVPEPGNSSSGMWQFNDNKDAHPEVSKECAFDPHCSSKEAFRVSAGGTDFNQWSTFWNGMYLAFMDRARAVTSESGPTAEQLRRFAWQECIGVPEDAALMKRGRELGLVPICGEGRGSMNGGLYVGQCFTDGQRMALVYCREGQWDKIYQQEL
jgi:hypothetical protein